MSPHCDSGLEIQGPREPRSPGHKAVGSILEGFYVLIWPFYKGFQSLVRRPRGPVISGNAFDYICPSSDTASQYLLYFAVPSPWLLPTHLFLNTFGPLCSDRKTPQCQRRCEKLFLLSPRLTLKRVVKILQ